SHGSAQTAKWLPKPSIYLALPLIRLRASCETRLPRTGTSSRIIASTSNMTAKLDAPRSCLHWLVLALTMIPVNADAADPLPRASERACDVQADVGVPSSRLATLARGFNLPGWLDSRAPQRPDL